MSSQAKEMGEQVTTGTIKKTGVAACGTGGHWLQRKCACGNYATGGKCQGCSKGKGLSQRLGGGKLDSDEAPAIVHDVLRSPGQPLDSATRAFMESHFGRDFSDVRVHTDLDAAQSAHAVGALAYTVGRDIVFGDGHYAPGTREGRSLLAHELTHAAQNGRGKPGASTPIAIGPEGDRFEAEADRLALNVARGEAAAASSPAISSNGQPGRLSRAKFKVGNAQVNIDYGDVYKSLTTDYQSVIEARFTAWTGSPASTIHNDLTNLSNAAKEWVVFALDLLVDNPVAGLDKVKAVQRLIDYAPAARFNHAADKSPTFNFANEALSVSGWFEMALTTGLSAPTGPRLSRVQGLLNPGTSSSATSSCPSPRPAADQLNATQLQSDMPVQLEAYLKKVIVPKTVTTPSMTPLLKVADVVQSRARNLFAPYADKATGSGNTFVQQWQYSSHMVSTQSSAGTPDTGKRLAYLDSRARTVGSKGLFAQVHFDPRCPADDSVLDGIIKQMEPKGNIRALVDPILRQKSYTDQNVTPKQVVLNPQYDPAEFDQCTGRWETIRTMCHELMHVMVHPDFRRAEKGRQILTEGVPEVLGHQLYDKISGEAGSNPQLQAQMEDGLGQPPCPAIPTASLGEDVNGKPTSYKKAADDADTIRVVVGGDRFRAAFFLGQLTLAGIQPKREDGSGSDEPREREADAAARAVAESRPLQTPISRAPLTADGSPAAVGAGAGLEPGLRREMETRLGHDFSEVRVHTDSEAARSAGAMRAQAYTAGRHIFFAAGRFSPGTSAGRQLIAHELTHVAQGGRGIARKPDSDGDSGIIPSGPLNLGGPALDRARHFEPRLREHHPTAPPASASWRRRVMDASSRPPGPTRTAAFLALINEAMAPDVQRFPELRFPVTLFRSNRAALHGEVSLDGASDSEPGRPGLRADTRTQQHAGEPQRRGFIVLTPGALHPEAGPDFTRRTVHHEYVHFLQNLRGELTVRPACVGTFRGRSVGGNANREVVAVSTTFARFFPPWADTDGRQGQRPPHHIIEDLMLLKASFRCAEEEIQTAAIERVVATVRGNPARRQVLLSLIREVSSRDTPDVTLARKDDAMARLSDVLGEPLPRDPRLPAQLPRPTFGPLFDLPGAIERSRARTQENLVKTVP